MSDNLVSGSSGATIAYDDISSVFYARAKLIHGADGVNAGDVSTANPLPASIYAGTTALNVGTGLATGALRVVSASTDPAVTALEIIDNLVLLEDAAHASADPGVQLLAVRNATPANLSGTDGDYEPLQVSAGRLWTSATLEAGTAGIGKLTANPGVTIGAVEIAAAQTLATVTTVSTVTNVATIGTSIVPGTGATHLGKAIDTATGATDTGVLALATRDDALTTLTPADGDNVQLRVNSSGALWVDLNGLAVYTTDVAAPASPVGLSLLAMRDDALSALTPIEGDWNQLRVNGRGALWTVQEGVLVDDAAFTPGTSYVFPIGFQADETATDSVDEGDTGCARMTLDRRVIVTEYPHTTGGLTMHKTVSAGSTNATSVKASAGKVYSIQATNVNAAVRYLKLYNLAVAPTVGTSVPVKTIALPGGTVGSTTSMTFPTGLEFGTGIAFALTTEATDAGTTGVSASEHVVMIDYK